jgi:hypothetical protein
MSYRINTCRTSRACYPSARRRQPEGDSRPCDIEVKPFGLKIDDYLFGLIYRCEDADDPDDPGAVSEYVMLEPNDIMFHPAWDSGEYST